MDEAVSFGAASSSDPSDPASVYGRGVGLGAGAGAARGPAFSSSSSAFGPSTVILPALPHGYVYVPVPLGPPHGYLRRLLRGACGEDDEGGRRGGRGVGAAGDASPGGDSVLGDSIAAFASRIAGCEGEEGEEHGGRRPVGEDKEEEVGVM